MDMNAISATLVEGCRAGTAHENLTKLYAVDAISVEASDNGQGREAQGIDAIKGKHDWWDATFEFVKGDISDPMPNGDDRFAVIFDITVKHKESGEVSDMKEVALYTVGDGKIVREEFFYTS
ncbi:MAG: SnoaL-like domain-containing protein [Tateyamaria sp.]|uniref:SnoaL-like domain-containing protein n=1 Tax=Tateyamaria sp. TaxID=1929288 RepID=UPI00328FF851